jgi:dihydrodipicolinate synthase/N-acetylneuraminate lyase
LSESTLPHPWDLLRPRRPIVGISAILLPFEESGQIDWPGFDRHVARTRNSGLTPAVNMDTGFGNLLDDTTRAAVLDRTRDIVGGESFVAGAFVGDRESDPFNSDAYRRAISAIADRGGTPVIFPSYGLTRQSGPEIVAAHELLAREADRLIAFELGTMFAPFGAIFDLDTYAGILRIPQIIGAKHSSLSRELEWDRIRLRDRLRPDFHVFTGNDLAIDMVMYGSDYLLGLSTFAPDLFAARDRFWLAGDQRFFELNDALQYLGYFAFRRPVPAYKHSAAQFLKIRGWIDHDATHPASPTRPDTDRDVLMEVAHRLGDLVGP